MANLTAALMCIVHSLTLLHTHTPRLGPHSFFSYAISDKATDSAPTSHAVACVRPASTSLHLGSPPVYHLLDGFTSDGCLPRTRDMHSSYCG